MGNSFFKKRKAPKHKGNEEIHDNLPAEDEENYFSGDLMQDSHFLKQLYAYPANIDFMVREFTVYTLEKRAVLFYVPSMTDAQLIEEAIIKPLITTNQVIFDVPSLISAGAVSEEMAINKAVKELNTGETLLLFEGEAQGFYYQNFKGRRQKC